MTERGWDKQSAGAGPAEWGWAQRGGGRGARGRDEQSAGAGLTEPILVVDPGDAWTTAAVVTGDGSQLLKESSSGSYCWPTSVAVDGQALRVGTIAERRKRSDPQLYAGQLIARLGSGGPVDLGGTIYAPHELVAAVLAVLRTEAQRLAGGPVDRILMLVPDAHGPATPLGQAMLAAAQAAGFTDAELLFLPAAIALAAEGGPTTGLALVCDAGASAVRVTLLELQGGRPGLARAHRAVTACGGNQLDTLLSGALQKKNGKWLRPLLAAGGAAGERARLDLSDLVRRLRHQVTDADRAEDTLTPLTPTVRLDRQDMERWIKQPIAQLVSGCRAVLASGRGAAVPAVMQAGGGGRGAAVPAVMLAGGCARTPAIQRAIAAALGRPVAPAPAPELAALRGGIEWANAAASHGVAALPVPAGLRELSWDVPGGAARLIGWRVPPGTGYGPGEPLATIRAEDDAIWDLTDDRPGVMAQAYPGPGTIVATADVLAVSRATEVTAADLRSRPVLHSIVPGGRLAAFSPDARQLVTVDAAGLLRIWDTETVAETGRFLIKASLRPNGLDATMTADGEWLAGYFDGSAVIVWNVTADRQVARVAKGKDTQAVQLSADGRRVCTADSKRARMWNTDGRELLSVKDRLPGAGTVAMSSDGLQLAVFSRAGLEVWDQASYRRTVVRALPRYKGTVGRLAFGANAARLLFAHDSALELISLPSGTCEWAVDLPVPVCDAGFAPGDRMLAVVSQPPGGAPARLVDPATGAGQGVLGPGDRSCASVRFSADGRFAVTLGAGAEGDTATVWALVR